MSKQFYLDEILSVTSGIKMSQGGMEGFNELLEFMTGKKSQNIDEKLRTFCAAALEMQYPDLKKLDFSDVNAGNVPFKMKAFQREMDTNALEVKSLAEMTAEKSLMPLSPRIIPKFMM